MQIEINKALFVADFMGWSTPISYLQKKKLRLCVCVSLFHSRINQKKRHERLRPRSTHPQSSIKTLWFKMLFLCLTLWEWSGGPPIFLNIPFSSDYCQLNVVLNFRNFRLYGLMLMLMLMLMLLRRPVY